LIPTTSSWVFQCCPLASPSWGAALMAMHYDPLMCHPASKALFALARKRASSPLPPPPAC
jgi:hypothetical protein